MSATSKILADLEKGLVISSSIDDRRKYKVRNLPDVIYQIKKLGLLIEKATKTYMINGSRYTTTFYWLERV